MWRLFGNAFTQSMAGLWSVSVVCVMSDTWIVTHIIVRPFVGPLQPKKKTMLHGAPSIYRLSRWVEIIIAEIYTQLTCPTRRKQLRSALGPIWRETLTTKELKYMDII